MRGDAVTEVRTLPSSHRGRRSLTVPLSRRNPSGLYFARVRDGHGGFAYAPFVLRAARGAHSRVAVVIPTNTWQAYNYRDDNRDGVPDSWYASPSVHSVSLSRPFIHHGAPPHYGPYDAAFEHWLVHTHKHADFLTDDDLETMPQATLRRRYALLVFPGHAEYATQRAYSLVEGYRNGGGNLMFLSANNFFYRVTRAGERITRTQRWRDIGRPEARWIGIQYVDWNHNQFHNAPYRVTDAHTLPWVFKGTGLHNGSRFGNYGIEIDARAASSPAGVHVLATAPNIFGAGKSAQMTYYESAGAKVFAAGAINFAGSATGPAVGRLLDNLWEHLRTR
jgi:hypothetical protein